MNNEKWIEHLDHWERFLEMRLETVENDGEKEKILRQLTAIERVRYSAVLNPQLLIDFINPDQELFPYEEQIDFIFDLNDSQRQAVEWAINDTKNLSLIQGPPGTGKTQVIAEICLQLYRRNPNVKILVCSETHVAVNNLISRISEHDDSIRVIRIRDKEQDSDTEVYSPESIIASYKSWLSETCSDTEIVDIICESIPASDNRSLEKALALSANIVGMTCNRVGAYRFLDTTEMFDYAIIDEACKATLPEILMPLIIAEKAVLVGDPKQLPPVFCSEDLDIINAIEDCDLQRYMYIDDLFVNSKAAAFLDTQYRMEHAIGTMVSHLFYNGTLKNGRDVDVESSLIWIDYQPTQVWPRPENDKDGKPMIRNLDEVSIICKLLNILDKQADGEISIAVITPYKYQIMELRRASNQYKNLKVDIDTVDGFQGKESDYVIFGLTRTIGSSRFLADSRRLNVALSRARNRVIIIGNKTYAMKNPLLNDVLAMCKVSQI